MPQASTPESHPPPVALAPPAAPTEIREPAEVACRISSEGWGSDQLRLRANGPRFARARGAPASVLVPVATAPTSAIAVLDDGRVVVRAVLAPADVRLFARKPLPLLGVVTPAAATELPWTSASAGAVRIGLDTTEVLRAPQPFVADVACAELAIVASSYDARASITKKKQLTQREVVSDGAPLAPGPKDKPVAELKQGVLVELVETRGAQARILIDSPSYLVSGWVSRKDLSTGVFLGGVYGVGGPGGEYGRGGGRLYLMHCPHEMGLFVELASERFKVGSIRADAGFRVLPEADEGGPRDFRGIELPENGWLALEGGARLLVEAPALAECHQDSPGF